MTKAQANQIKQRLRAEGMTLGAWAIANGFKYRDVSDVVRGVRRGYYGVGRDIAIKLGFDPDTSEFAADMANPPAIPPCPPCLDYTQAA